MRGAGALGPESAPVGSREGSSPRVQPPRAVSRPPAPPGRVGLNHGRGPALALTSPVTPHPHPPFHSGHPRGAGILGSGTEAGGYLQKGPRLRGEGETQPGPSWSWESRMVRGPYSCSLGFLTPLGRGPGLRATFSFCSGWE